MVRVDELKWLTEELFSRLNDVEVGLTKKASLEGVDKIISRVNDLSETISGLEVFIRRVKRKWNIVVRKRK